MLLPELRSEIVWTCQSLLASGLLRGTSGNLSARDPATDTVAITPTGVPYPQLSPDDVAVLALDGRQLAGSKLPTSEIALHLSVYRARPEVAAVVHTHSMFATVYAACGVEIPAVHYLIARAGTSVPIAEYARYGTVELAQNCVATLADGDAVLLANHGLVAVGADLAGATVVAEAVEFTAELAWRAGQLGAPQVLSPEQLAEALTAFSSYGQPKQR